MSPSILASLLPFSYRNFLHAIYLEAIKFKFINYNQQQLTINKVCINFQKIPFIKYSIKTSQPPHEVGTIIIRTLQMRALRVIGLTGSKEQTTNHRAKQCAIPQIMIRVTELFLEIIVDSRTVLKKEKRKEIQQDSLYTLPSFLQ